ncbi:DUF3304 domain-containing protein [Duganella sp. BJB488]|uniref:DUF3304 domain-containing protein n=1 Tax=unclassified Duganella TaxID=2636909 RepID=UPI000E343E24|nr:MULTISPECIES: DUF3304 domain-containing protein [unclassified Duganella]RFP14173.1 DUF3304 domain-containing protein [Duganella sp. BJB489]RFP17244.1 DUF3304 domain-containing protein [Duganella sp. BJB488]RFP31966.1 DUF3304 domain-containing protein [Duganella sp. BJB480]
MNLKTTFHLALLFTGMSTLLAGCAHAPPAGPRNVGAAVRSINYSGKEVSLIVIDPNNKNNSGGGDALNPYSSGGTICCFAIPAEWHPGLQVIVKYNFYPDPIWREQLVDVPPYPEGIAGGIWLAMHEDGRAEAVVSKFDPTRPEWPGRVKGEPVESEAYALKVRNDRLTTQKKMLSAMEAGLKYDTAKLNEQEIEELKEAIENTKRRIQRMEEQP